MKDPIGVFECRWGFSVFGRRDDKHDPDAGPPAAQSGNRFSLRQTRSGCAEIMLTTKPAPRAGKENGAGREKGGPPCRFPPCPARIRKLIPPRHDDRYEEIVRGFGNGVLRAPTPMSDQELSRAIADFLKDAPSVDCLGELGRRLDPSSQI